MKRKMNILQKALHLAAKKVIVKSEVDAVESERRFAICTGCEHRDPTQNKCNECGCFLDLKCASASNWNPKRMRNEITHCPFGKWEDIEITNLYRKMDGKELLQTN
jgi:hypothetical protein